MATSAVKGRRASVLVVPTTQATSVFNEVRNWSLTLTEEMIDASSADSSGWNEVIPGQRGWVFRAETLYGAGNAGVGTDIRRMVKQFTANGNISIFRLALDVASTFSGITPTSAGGFWKSGSSTGGSPIVGHVTNYRVGGRYNDVQLFEFEITGNGTLTYSSA